MDARQKAQVKSVATGTESKPDLTVRGDELEDAGKLQKVAEVLEDNHMDEQADAVKKHVRHIVAKELNELDGFDR
jgi:hypothetical protein